MTRLESQKRDIVDFLDEALARAIRLVAYRKGSTSSPKSQHDLKELAKASNSPELHALLNGKAFKGGVEPALHEGWIAEALSQVRESIENIITHDVYVFRRRRRSTNHIFEKHIDSALLAFGRYPSGINICISEFFSSSDRYTSNGIKELEHLSELVEKIQRRLKIFRSRFWSFFTSPIPLAIAAIVLVLSVPATYYAVAVLEARSPDAGALQESVNRQVMADAEKLKSKLDNPNTGPLQKTAEISKELKEIVGNLKSFIAALLAILEAIRRFRMR